MVANFTADNTPRGFNFNTAPVAKTPRSRHYDSFVVRLWQDEDSDGMLRVELQHVQAGLSIEAQKVPLDWIVPGIMGCLQSSNGEKDGDAEAHNTPMYVDGPYRP